MSNSKRGIENALGIPSVEELQKAMSMLTPDNEICEEDISTEEIQTALTSAKDLKKSLTIIPDVLEKETEIDEIADSASKYFEDIMDKAFNTEDRFAPELFNAANALLKTALDGKTAIINAKLKLLDLELKKQRAESSVKPTSHPEKEINSSGVTISDRNSLLKRGTQ